MSNLLQLKNYSQSANFLDVAHTTLKLPSYTQTVEINVVENLDQPYIPLYDSLNSDIYDSNNLRVRMSNSTYGILLFKSVYTSSQIDEFISEVI